MYSLLLFLIPVIDVRLSFLY